MAKLLSTIVFALIAAIGGAIAFYVFSGDLERAQLVAGYEQKLRQAQAREAELVRQKQLLAEKLERLGSERLVAKAMVIHQQLAPDGAVLATHGVFEEVGRANGLMPAKTFRVPGDTVHFDALLIQFPKDAVAEGDPLRGHTLHLFRRIYGETQAPTEGLYFDPNRDIPDIYRVDAQPGEYEKQLWDSFWQMALDPKLAASYGVRVVLGQDVYTKMAPGMVYELIVQADGGLVILPKELDAAYRAAFSRPTS